ncbi:MAG: glutamine-hydrolyzing carbamoyl-phosphate synthase small subunit [Candidatus Aminicenantes bacterium]|nr:glutamine-hydrolyzing carbamoyl-phosphate synthase small subunit [Candidatus Aminicenantes bacterium]
MEELPKKASLILEDSSVFSGFSFGKKRSASGEVVFNTGMVGYPESLTDPSYQGQILVLTYPLIGNYGVPSEKRIDGLLKYFESDRIHAEGLVIADYSSEYSHWNAAKSLGAWLAEQKIPGIFGVDTRRLTKKLREKGTMPGKIINSGKNIKQAPPGTRHLVAEVSLPKPVVYPGGKTKIILVDCGVKNSIIRAFLRRNLTIIRVPWDYDFLQEEADGIILSNGPGDPIHCEATIQNVRKALDRNIPIFGICLGSQILGLAAGAHTYKLKYGHRSQNQPCAEGGTRRIYITTQNHGYALDADTLPLDWREWFSNQNDGTNEGIIHVSKPFFGTQFHPEASPGPDDTEFIFDMFVRAIER